MKISHEKYAELCNILGEKLTDRINKFNSEEDTKELYADDKATIAIEGTICTLVSIVESICEDLKAIESTHKLITLSVTTKINQIKKQYLQ